jgi:hypothetical protein
VLSQKFLCLAAQQSRSISGRNRITRISVDASLPMSDYPRFTKIKGSPDEAHKAYHGGALVSFVFRFVDARFVGRHGKHVMRATQHAPSELREFPNLPAPASMRARLASTDSALLACSTPPSEAFSDSFLIGSARTMKLQSGLLAAIAVLLVLLATQGLTLPERRDALTTRHTVPLPMSPIKTVRAEMPGL